MNMKKKIPNNIRIIHQHSGADGVQSRMLHCAAFVLFYFAAKLQDAQNTNICSVGLRGRSPLFVEALFTFPFSNGALRRRGHTV